MKGDIELPEYSVCMSVYSGERADFFRQSVMSMLEQTHPCKELIIVCDGELSGKLNSVVQELSAAYPQVVRVIKMPEKSGVGACANAAMQSASADIIVKMDSDDIALPDRCQKQLTLLARRPDIDMCGGFIEEFDSESGEPIALRRTPVTHEEIMSYARRRNPINNQTLVYRRAAAMKVGYSSIARCEDYEFVTRMLQSGARAENIPEVLVRYRVTPQNLTRRRNFRNTRSFIAVRYRIFRSGFSGLLDFLIPCAAQLVLFVLPKSLTGRLYKKFLRK